MKISSYIPYEGIYSYGENYIDNFLGNNFF